MCALYQLSVPYIDLAEEIPSDKYIEYFFDREMRRKIHERMVELSDSKNFYDLKVLSQLWLVCNGRFAKDAWQPWEYFKRVIELGYKVSPKDINKYLKKCNKKFFRWYIIEVHTGEPCVSRRRFRQWYNFNKEYFGRQSRFNNWRRRLGQHYHWWNWIWQSSFDNSGGRRQYKRRNGELKLSLWQHRRGDDKRRNLQVKLGWYFGENSNFRQFNNRRKWLERNDWKFKRHFDGHWRRWSKFSWFIPHWER